MHCVKIANIKCVQSKTRHFTLLHIRDVLYVQKLPDVKSIPHKKTFFLEATSPILYLIFHTPFITRFVRLGERKGEI